MNRLRDLTLRAWRAYVTAFAGALDRLFGPKPAPHLDVKYGPIEGAWPGFRWNPRGGWDIVRCTCGYGEPYGPHAPDCPAADPGLPEPVAHVVYWDVLDGGVLGAVILSDGELLHRPYYQPDHETYWDDHTQRWTDGRATPADPDNVPTLRATDAEVHRVISELDAREPAHEAVRLCGALSSVAHTRCILDVDHPGMHFDALGHGWFARSPAPSPIRCPAVRPSNGQRCVLAAGHSGGHLDGDHEPWFARDEGDSIYDTPRGEK